MSRLPIQPRQAATLILAFGTWAGAAAGRWWGIGGLATVAAAAVIGLVSGRRRLAALGVVLVAAGWWSGMGSMTREQAILRHPSAEGEIAMSVRLLGDPRSSDHGWWVRAVADPAEPGRSPSVPMLLTFEEPPPGAAGEVLVIDGFRTSRTGRARGDPYSGVVRVERAQVVSAGATWWAVGNRVRRRVLEQLRGADPPRALLAGFLVGDTEDLPPIELEAMRRSGLTHLVAVSGSNVSLFLTLTVLAAGPLASGPRRRALVGLLAIFVLLVATRWEPSVVRASVMAALLLTGRIGGWAPDPATALSATVIMVVTVSGEMSTDVGFTMSVLATAGVLAGTKMITGLPRPIATVAGATLGAQMAVAPVVLAVFGSIPLLAPLTNLVAVPIVSLTTTVAAIGVMTGWQPLIGLAATGASAVLAVARVGSVWPQVGWTGYVVACGAAALFISRRWRPVAAVVAASIVFAVLAAPSRALPLPAAVILDVGQGDSIIVVASDGSTMLVDGGPEPAVLDRKLAGYGIDALDLVVLTHVHADHASGLEAVIGRRAVGTVWFPTPPHSTPASERVVRLAHRFGLVLEEPPVGEVFGLGDLGVEVVAPLRRYASPNDQSIVLRVTAPGGPSLLLTGDIETYAQADLSGLTADILKVPHQGAATSDPEWLTAVGADWAIISVGENDYGHPSAAVIETLRAAGARVSRTDLDGDVVVPLAPSH